MESQQLRRRKQEKPRHLNNQDDDDDVRDPAINDDRTGEVSTEDDNFLCKSCHIRLPTKFDLSNHLAACHHLHAVSPKVSWEEFQTQNRPPVINLMKKKFPLVSTSNSDNKTEELCSGEVDDGVVRRFCELPETGDDFASSDAKKMRLTEQEEEEEESDDDDHHHHHHHHHHQGPQTPQKEIAYPFKNPSMNLHQLNMLLLQLQQHQIIHWQVLDAIRKKVIDDNMPPNSDVFNDMTSLFLRHQKEIANISATYKLAVGFLNRGEVYKPSQEVPPHLMHLYNSMVYNKHNKEDSRNGIIAANQNLDKMEESQQQRISELPSPHDHHHDHHHQDKPAEEDDDDDDDDVEDDEDMMEEDGPIKCSVCGEFFPSKEILKIHFQHHLEQNIHLNKTENHLIDQSKIDQEEIDDESIRRDHLAEEKQNENKEHYSGFDLFSDKAPNVHHISPEEIKEFKSQDVDQHFGQTKSLEHRNISAKRDLVYDGDGFKGGDFKSPLVALSSMSSALNFTKAPMSLIFPGERSISSQAYQSFRYNNPASLMKSAILAPNGHDDPLEQYMEIQVTEHTKMEDLIKEGESKVTDPNECAICHRVLSCRSALQMHYRTHTGERPYKCKLCSRTFTTKGNLKTHMSVHRGKPLQRQLHKCPICSREFSNPLVLQQHFRSHTSDPQKTFTNIFPGVIPGMFMPPINPFFSYPINPNPYFNPLFSSQFAAKNFPNITKVFQGQKTSPNKLIESPVSNILSTNGIQESSIVKEPPELERRQEVKVQVEGLESLSQINGKFEDISDKSSDESDEQDYDQKEQNSIFSSDEIRKYPYNSVLKPEENHPPSDSKLSYMSPLVALADRVNALNHQYAFSDNQRQQRDGTTKLDTSRNVSEDFNKILRTPTSLSTPMSNSFLSSPLFLKATDAKGGVNDNNSNLLGAGKASAACPICGKMFSCKSAVDIHMRSHTKERPFRCEYCDRAFTTKGNLKQHVGTNHHVIARASDQTNSQIELRTTNWMSDSSSSASPFSSSAAIVSSNMISSPKVKLEITGNESQNEQKPKDQGNSSSESNKNPNGARYFCTACEKPFSSTSALQIHSRTHTGDRPFVCPTCNKAFTTKGNLKVHMGTHAWNKVPSRRGRRMSVEPLGPQFNTVLNKDQVVNPSILASIHQKMNCAERFPYSLIGLPTPNLFPSKLSDHHHLAQGFHSKLPLMASLQSQSLFYPSYVGNFESLRSPTVKSNLPHEVTVKTEKLDNETELDLSIKKPSPPVSSTPNKPLMLLREGSDWSSDVKPHHLALNCR